VVGEVVDELEADDQMPHRINAEHHQRARNL
jgi:hypothetical protein